MLVQGDFFRNLILIWRYFFCKNKHFVFFKIETNSDFLVFGQFFPIMVVSCKYCINSYNRNVPHFKGKKTAFSQASLFIFRRSSYVRALMHEKNLVDVCIMSFQQIVEYWNWVEFWIFIYFFVFYRVKKTELLCKLRNEISQPFVNLEGAPKWISQ